MFRRCAIPLAVVALGWALWRARMGAPGAPLLVPGMVATGLAVDRAGNLFVADYENDCVWRISRWGSIARAAGSGEEGYAGDGSRATQARLHDPIGVAIGPDGSLFIADSHNCRVRRVDPGGVITTLAGDGRRGCFGDGGPATRACLAYPVGLAMGGDGCLYVADSLSCRVRKVDRNGVITTAAGRGRRGATPAVRPQRASDLLPVADMLKGTRFGGDGGRATQADLAAPIGIATDPAGGLYIADAGNRRVRKVDRSGVIRTVARADEAVRPLWNAVVRQDPTLAGWWPWVGQPLGVAVHQRHVMFGVLFLAAAGIHRAEPSGRIVEVARPVKRLMW